MNRKFLAAIMIVLGISLMAISTVLIIIPVEAQTNPSNNVPELPQQETILTDTVINATDTSTDDTVDNTMATASNTDSDDKKIPDAVAFELTGAVAECPGDTTKTNLISHANPYGAYQYFYSTDGIPVAGGKIYEQGENRHYSAEFYITWGDVDPVTDTYRLVGLLHDDSSRICPTHDRIFDIEIRGACDGSIFALTTNNANGYSITASGNQVHADCSYAELYP